MHVDNPAGVSAAVGHRKSYSGREQHGSHGNSRGDKIATPDHAEAAAKIVTEGSSCEVRQSAVRFKLAAIIPNPCYRTGPNLHVKYVNTLLKDVFERDTESGDSRDPLPIPLLSCCLWRCSNAIFKRYVSAVGPSSPLTWRSDALTRIIMVRAGIAPAPTVEGDWRQAWSSRN